jgi:hypothetical protein
MPWHSKEKYQHTTINMDRTLEDVGSTAVALEDGGGAAALGGTLGGG